MYPFCVINKSKQHGTELLTYNYFEDFFLNQTLNTSKRYTVYLGISRKDHPKWAGWDIIKQYQVNGVEMSVVQDDKLDLLVKNFYMVKFLEYLES